jgi:hypothetical protein
MERKDRTSISWREKKKSEVRVLAFALIRVGRSEKFDLCLLLRVVRVQKLFRQFRLLFLRLFLGNGRRGSLYIFIIVFEEDSRNYRKKGICLDNSYPAAFCVCVCSRSMSDAYGSGFWRLPLEPTG